MKPRKTPIDVETEVPESTCCECGYRVTHASGPCKPSPGDYTLCIECTSLNIFADDLTVRRPTIEEYCTAAASSELQALRRVMLAVHARRPKS